MLDKIYCYARANNIYFKTKDGKPPKLKNLKLLSVDKPKPKKVVSSSRKRKMDPNSERLSKRMRVD